MITIIIPAYNADRTLHYCISSVLNQTYKDFEIIVVNDGSTDNTCDIVAQLSKNDKRIKYFEKCNEGVSIARNFGVTKANNDLLFFLDADDYLDEKTLEILMYEFNTHHPDLVACEIVDKDSGYAAKHSFSSECTKYASARGDVGRLLYYIRPSAVIGKLFRKKLIVENGLHFSTNMQLAEDFVFVHEYMKYAQTISKCVDSLYIVQNINENSLSKKYIRNIDLILKNQLTVMEEAFKAYPEYEREWYKYATDINVKNCMFFTKNLFLKGNHLSYKEKKKELTRFFIQKNNFQFFSIQVVEKKPKNISDKIQYYTLNTKNISLILCIFYCIEFLKRISHSINKCIK